MKVDELNDTPNSSISKNNPNPYVHNILHQIISTLPHQSYTMMNEQYVIPISLVEHITQKNKP